VDFISAWRQVNFTRGQAMTLRAEYTLGHSEFNAFLFAPVGEEKTGLPLTVLSALSRLGIDPWGEAARLTSLPVDAAVQALSAAIARLPVGDWKLSDASTIAARLVVFLPRRGTLGAPQASDQRKSAATSKLVLAWPKPAVWLMVIAIALGWYMLMSHLTTSDHLEAPAVTSAHE
jgi:hypothetical protein